MIKEDLLSEEELIALGKRLIAVRKQVGVKQKEMAETMGVSASYVSDIEKGKSNPGFNFLVKLALEYKVSLDWLVFEKGEMFTGLVEKEGGKLLDFDFGDETGQVLEMLEKMRKSRFFKNHMMANYIRACFENRNIIEWDMDYNTPKEREK